MLITHLSRNNADALQGLMNLVAEESTHNNSQRGRPLRTSATEGGTGHRT